MKLVYQTNIDQPTQELTEQVLREITDSVTTNTLIANYRKLKSQMAEAEAKEMVEEFVQKVLEEQDYKDWLSQELKKDEHRSKKRVPEDDLKRVKLYINSMKSGLPAVIPTATFTESTDRWGRDGLWRVQDHGYLTGFGVLDADHVPHPEEVIREWLQREDFQELGIVWIFITPSGEGIKVVFKAREDWGNLADNYYTLAEKLGVLDYADSQCKNSDHTHFIPRLCDIRFIDWQELFEYENPEYEKKFGEAYRNGHSEPTQPKWQELERQRKASRKGTTEAAKPSNVTSQSASSTSQPTELTERQKAIVKALNEYYGKSLGEGQKHPTFCQQTSHWLCWLADNNPQTAIAMAYQLDYVKDWQPQPNEIEDLINSAANKKILKCTPKELRDLLAKAGIEAGVTAGKTSGADEEDLPFAEWTEQIRGLFDVYPCVREICEQHPERLWPFLLFAGGAMLGTCATLTWYYFYDNPNKPRRLNYNVLGIGDPASGKGALEWLASLLTEPLEVSDQLANDAMNDWKEAQLSKGANKDKAAKPKGIIRLHGARTSNNVFINDMVNAWTEVNGERMQMHMLTIDTEALNSIKMQKGGSWIDRQVLEIKSWSNEKDSQQYANLDSVMGFFKVYWNQVRTCTPPALKMLANDRTFGTGWPTRVIAIPVPGTGFKMLELRRQSKKALETEETLRQWAYRMDKRRGELPLWPLVEHAWHWADNRMSIADFNNDKADELLLKRCPANALAIVAPFVDMRHWVERGKNGTYEPDDTDKALLDLVLDVVYRTQHHYFGELAHNYFDEQTKEATNFRRRTGKFSRCFAQLPESFTTEDFTRVFGYANQNSANKTLNRLLDDKAIRRTKRGEYVKRVQSID